MEVHENIADADKMYACRNIKHSNTEKVGAAWG